MCRLRYIFKHLLPGVLLLLSASMLAQEDKLIRAQELLRAKKVNEAKLAIDSVIVHPQTSSDFRSWTVRAFIYFDLYKQTDKFKLHSDLRDTVLSSIKISNSLKPDTSFKDQNKKLAVNLGRGYFNLATKILYDSLNYERSLKAYMSYKEVMGWAEPSEANIKEVEYYLGVGSLFADIFIKDNKNTKAGDIAKVALMKVLEIQPNNVTANLDMGLIYYNQGADLSRSLDYGESFDQIDIVMENMIKLGKQSEQFIAKAYSIDNNNTRAIEALFYVYRMLNDIPKSDEFKKKGVEKGIKFEPEGGGQQKKEEQKDNKQQNKDK